MPTRLLSLFGSYDFLAKTLPGIAFVIGLFPLLKNNSVPFPDITDNILMFITILAIIGLFGTLFGEIVHSVANHLEDVAEWGGRLAQEIKNRIAYATGIQLPRPSEESPNRRRHEGNEEAQLFLRLYRRSRRLLRGGYSRVFTWGDRRFKEAEYIVWGHRNQFSTRIKSPASSSFAQQYMINFVLDDLKDPPPHNYDEIYMVVTSFLSNTGCERAFRFQSRYAFCRSMAFVSLFIGSVYYLVAEYPSSWPVPNALDYHPYLLAYYSEGSNPNSTIIFISIILIFLSIIFSRAAGAYKRYYVEYLIAEFYAVREILDEE